MALGVYWVGHATLFCMCNMGGVMSAIHSNASVLILRWFIIAVVAHGLAACREDSVPENQVFTLYQNAPSDPSARVAVATFDMRWGEKNNYYYCQKFAAFLQAEWDTNGGKQTHIPGVKDVRHWCEKGRYRE